MFCCALCVQRCKGVVFVPITYKREEVCSGISYTEIIDSRLKTNTICVSFFEPIKAENASANAILPSILTDSSAVYPSVTELSRKLESLYGANIRGGVSKAGDYQVIMLSASCINDDYTINKEKIFAELIETFVGCIFDPYLQDGAFAADDFALKKQELLDDIDAEINNKRAYAFRRAAELIYCGEPAAVPETGSREDAGKLTPQSAYTRYREVLRSSGAEIIYIGKDMSLQDKDKLLAPFRALERDHGTFDAIKRSPLKTEAVSKTERLNIMQSKMILAFKTSFEDQAAMRMFSAVYGETPVSKLFSNVREKLSLCYYCPCGFKDDRKGVLFVDCGVEHDNLEPAKKEILAQLEEIRKGNFTDDEINSARLAIINSLKGINDIPSRIANRYMNRFITGQEVISPEKEIERIKAVAKHDIIAAAESVSLDTVYILTGKE